MPSRPFSFPHPTILETAPALSTRSLALGKDDLILLLLSGISTFENRSSRRNDPGEDGPSTLPTPFQEMWSLAAGTSPSSSNVFESERVRRGGVTYTSGRPLISHLSPSWSPPVFFCIDGIRHECIIFLTVSIVSFGRNIISTLDPSGR